MKTFLEVYNEKNKSVDKHTPQNESNADIDSGTQKFLDMHNIEIIDLPDGTWSPFSMEEPVDDEETDDMMGIDGSDDASDDDEVVDIDLV